MSADEIVWTDPPRSTHPDPDSRVDRRSFVDALPARPGEWALYPATVSAASTASVYRRNFPGTEWTARKRADGRYDVYARWVGEQ